MTNLSRKFLIITSIILHNYVTNAQNDSPNNQVELIDPQQSQSPSYSNSYNPLQSRGLVPQFFLIPSNSLFPQAFGGYYQNGYSYPVPQPLPQPQPQPFPLPIVPVVSNHLPDDSSGFHPQNPPSREYLPPISTTPKPATNDEDEDREPLLPSYHPTRRPPTEQPRPFTPKTYFIPAPPPPEPQPPIYVPQVPPTSYLPVPSGVPAIPVIPTIAESGKEECYPKYSFAYEVNDLTTGDVKHHEESRDGDVVRGSYSLLEPDGSTREVKYQADDVNGFTAVVSNSVQVHPSPKIQPVVVGPVEPQLAPVVSVASVTPVAPVARLASVAPVARLGSIVSSVAPVASVSPYYPVARNYPVAPVYHTVTPSYPYAALISNRPELHYYQAKRSANRNSIPVRRRNLNN